MSHSKSHLVNDKFQPIDIGVQIEEILKRKAHLKWYRDKNKKWYIVHSHQLSPSKRHKPEIILPTTGEKIVVNDNRLITLRQGVKANNDDYMNYTILNEVINTIDTLYQSLYNDKKRKIINNLKKELQQQKSKIKDCKLEQTKKLRSKMAENEKKYEILKNEFLSEHYNEQDKLKKKNNELKRDFENLNKHYNDLKLKATPKGDKRNDETRKYIEQLHEEIKTLKQEKNKLNEIIKTKDVKHARVKTELDIERGWMNVAIGGNKSINEITKGRIKSINEIAIDINDHELEELSDYAPDYDEEYEVEFDHDHDHEEDVKEEEKKNMGMDMDKLYAINSISESKSMSAMSSLNEFGHKYSTKNLNKCNKAQLIEMIVSLYVSNENFKQELRENILGVGCEDTFLNIDEILNKYATLRTQTHNNLHNNLLDVLEEKYNDDDDDVNDDILEKQSYNILFHILYLSNSKISLEFNNLYTKIAKIIKVYKEKNSIKLISNILHSTLQTHYKLLIHSILDEEEKDEDSIGMFDLNKQSKTIYDELLIKFSDWDKMLNSVQGDIINYIKCCLEMVVIVQLNKPKLHFVHLNEFINQTSEKFDENKHEQCNYDYDEYNDSQLKLLLVRLKYSKQPKYIQYYCFPGLCIENNINIKGDKKHKKKKKGNKDKYVVICKTQVVC